MSSPSDRDAAINLLSQAQSLARRLHEPILEYLIERALDEARASTFLPQEEQTPYEPMPPNVLGMIRRAAKRGGEPD